MTTMKFLSCYDMILVLLMELEGRCIDQDIVHSGVYSTERDLYCQECMHAI